MWGSTTPNTADECTWASYKYCNGTYRTLTKYCTNSSYGTVDNKTALEPEDDAATQIMGDEWRMPTDAELYELLSGTTNEWTTVNGVNGWKFTSKTDTSKYIFIPAAGYCEDGSVYYVGDDGGVWSSSLKTSDPYYAWHSYFSPDDYSMDYNSRSNGRSVRGVRK